MTFLRRFMASSTVFPCEKGGTPLDGFITQGPGLPPAKVTKIVATFAALCTEICVLTCNLRLKYAWDNG